MNKHTQNGHEATKQLPDLNQAQQLTKDSLIGQLSALKLNGLPKLDYIPIDKANPPVIVTNIPTELYTDKTLHIIIGYNGKAKFYNGKPESDHGSLIKKSLGKIVDELSIRRKAAMAPLPIFYQAVMASMENVKSGRSSSLGRT